MFHLLSFILLCYLGPLSANYFLIKLYLMFKKEVKESEMKELTIIMFIPAINVALMLALTIVPIFEIIEIGRKKHKNKVKKIDFSNFLNHFHNIQKIEKNGDTYYMKKEKKKVM